MKVLALLAALSCAAAAPPAPAQDAPAPPRMASDRLPVLGTVGDAPPAAERILVEVEPAGWLSMDGRTAYLDSFRKVLRTRATAARRKDGENPLSVLIRADRETPWQAVRWLLAECAAPEAGVRRVFFAARPEDGGEEGAFAAFLGEAEVPDEARPKRFRLRWWDVREELSPFDAFAYLGERTPFLRDLHKLAVVSATPRMHTGLVLQTADALIRWGVADVRLEGPAPASVADLEAAVKGLPAESGRLSLLANDSPLRAFGPKARTAPAIARVQGKQAGLFAERSLAKTAPPPAPPEAPVAIAGSPGSLPRLGFVGDLPA